MCQFQNLVFRERLLINTNISISIHKYQCFNSDISVLKHLEFAVLQGCVLSPLLFNIMLEVVMALGEENQTLGISVSGTVCSNLRFADDISLLADNQEDLQSKADSLQEASSRFGLKISCSKTEVQCVSRNPAIMNINIAGIKLNQVDQCILGRSHIKRWKMRKGHWKKDRPCNRSSFFLEQYMGFKRTEPTNKNPCLSNARALNPDLQLGNLDTQGDRYAQASCTCSRWLF